MPDWVRQDAGWIAEHAPPSVRDKAAQFPPTANTLPPDPPPPVVRTWAEQPPGAADTALADITAAPPRPVFRAVGGGSFFPGPVLNLQVPPGYTDPHTWTPASSFYQVSNVVSFGADPTGLTDSTTAIQNALNSCPSGGTVFLPPGVYKTSSPLTLPPQVTLLGTVRNLAYPGGAGATPVGQCIIQPSAAFSGVAVIQLLGQNDGGYSFTPGDNRLIGFTIDGSVLGGSTVHGIRVSGNVHGPIFRDLLVENMGGDGFRWEGDGSSVFPDFCEMSYCKFSGGSSYGINVRSFPDSYVQFTESTGNTLDNWHLINCGNTRFVGCKAESSGTGYGFWFQNTASGITGQAATFTSCSTQNNQLDGVFFTGGGIRNWIGGFVQFDNRSQTAGNLSAFNLSANSGLVIIDGTVTGVTGGGSPFPFNGLTIGSNTGTIVVSNSFLWGATNAINWDGTGNVIFGPDNVPGTGSTFTAGTLPAAQASPQPADLAYLGWTFDGAAASSATTLTATSGNLSVWKIPIRQQISVTGIRVYLATAGGTLTAAENFIGLYSSTGAQIGTSADQTANWGGTGVVVDANLTGGPFLVQPPFAWVVLLWNGTTAPSFERGITLTNGYANGKLTAATSRYGTYTAGGPFTSLPGSITPASITQDNKEFWAALF